MPQNEQSLQPDSFWWNMSQKTSCSNANPHLSQSRAKPPDRSGQPFRHSPTPAAVGAGAPHAAFMHLAAPIPAMAGRRARANPPPSLRSSRCLPPAEKGRLSPPRLAAPPTPRDTEGGAEEGRGLRARGGGGVVFRWMWREQPTHDRWRLAHAVRASQVKARQGQGRDGGKEGRKGWMPEAASGSNVN